MCSDLTIEPVNEVRPVLKAGYEITGTVPAVADAHPCADPGENDTGDES
jgi:hypothetical protein